VALLLDRTGRQRKIEFIWTLWNENEENAWELVRCGRGGLGVLYSLGKGGERLRMS
jgi:hypothetical protein